MVDGSKIVLFIWQVRDELVKYLSDGLGDVDNVVLLFPEDTSEEVLLELAPQADIVVGWRPSREFLERAKNLSLFINPGAGVQHHIETFRELNRKREVALVNGHGNSYFTAQHAVSLLLTLTNKIVKHHNWMSQGEWRRGDKHAASTPMRSRKVGLLGYGAVNSKVHKFLSGFEVEFHILKRQWSETDNHLPTPAEKYDCSQLHEFLSIVDTLIVAVPETDETVNLIGDRELELLGVEGLLVNMARGVVINEKSLYNALKNGMIAGAAIDVWYEYRPEPDEHGCKYPYHHPFHELENVVLSPHRGASPFGDLKRWQEVVDNIQRFAEGRKDFRNRVDLEHGY